MLSTLTSLSLSVASVLQLRVRVVNMVVTRRLAPRSLGKTVSGSLVHGVIVSNISPESDMIDSVKLVGHSKPAELVVGPGVDGEMGDEDLERVEGAAIGAEIDELV